MKPVPCEGACVKRVLCDNGVKNNRNLSVQLLSEQGNKCNRLLGKK